MQRILRCLSVVVLALLCSGANREELRRKVMERMRNHPVRQATYWPKLGTAETPRIESAPPEIVEYVLMDNVLNGFRERPQPSLDASVMRDLRSAWASLPPSVRKLAAHRTGGIFLVDALGGSAYTEVITNASGETIGAFIVVDADVMSKAPNAWMTWKERTPFKAGPYTLHARIAPEGSEERMLSIRYLLLHELGHVLGESVGAHPQWLPSGRVEKVELAAHPFLQLGWQDGPKGGVVTRFEAGRPGRFRYYQPEARRMENTKMAPSYRWLQSTPFATLYSLNSIFDDFAEAFANYVHVVSLGAPYAIEVHEDGQAILRYDACWDEPRCAEKGALLEALLRSASAQPAQLP